MHAYRPDRVVRLLSALATAAYGVAWVFAVFLLVALPLGKLLAGRAQGSSSGWSVQLGIGGVAVSAGTGGGFRVEVPVTLAHTLTRLPAWRDAGGRLRVTEVKATASVPMSSLSAGTVVLLWAALAVFLALVLLFLYQLRRLFQRVRQGEPFDPGNAVRLRWLGILLVAAAVWKGVTDFWLSLVVSRLLEGPGNDLGTTFGLDGAVIMVALVLIALAEIFRRGAALEDEQALVV